MKYFDKDQEEMYRVRVNQLNEGDYIRLRNGWYRIKTITSFSINGQVEMEFDGKEGKFRFFNDQSGFMRKEI
jgi:hypothetical protein